MSASLFDLPPELIPGQLREIADNTSEHIALVLLETYPGSYVCIPQAPVDGHLLSDRLTEAEFKQLCAVYGKNTLKIPKADKARRARRNQLILQDHYINHLTQGQIAIKYGLDVAWIGKICNRVAIAPTQIDLFE